ncbi:ParB/RepB/Spo0J family partition protein [Geobacter sp. SVR]|uniref:ParB/RepB/Spo0J family partition protein n=1 Tax=Geobacter sp. SVR TaxID=2495594 RepID=UPI00143EFAA2|nr:ParB/RepB/Spo0J family partition protein [Geobacter sp. SVR]BCS55584.1 chromosome partitioning protein ParB [Geobacter sp. SVR]GCF83587.1 chromosome partitioning protein ParB [Geobacter sp. SVR]
MLKKGGLGKGMAALLQASDAVADQAAYFICPIEQIRPNKNQPRKNFSPEKLEELAASIREQGIIQPLVVTQKNGFYEIIAGERRWRAAQKAGLREVPVVIREASEEAVLELALIENIQRQDLNAIEEAQAYRSLVEHLAISQEDVARRVGKNRTTVTNSLRLLRLPDEVQRDIVEERLSMGHARALLALEAEELIEKARREILQRQLSVRSTEDLVRRLKINPHPAVSKRPQQPDLLMSSLEEQLQKRFQSRVAIRRTGSKGGRLEIHFSDSDELTRIIDLLDV